MKNFFTAKNTIAIRTLKGERRLNYSSFHKWSLFGVFFLGFIMISGLTAESIHHFLQPSTTPEISDSIHEEYQARIDSLIAERDELASSLEVAKHNEAKLIETLGRQQDMLFEFEREKYELSANVTSMRSGMIAKQNSLDALNLQLEGQKEQLTALQNGEAVTSGGTTFATITQTLAETALARDQAREQVQLLREQIVISEAEQQAQEEKRNVLFSQIEEAVESSLAPLRSTLDRTGLNVDSLLGNIRQSYSGAGGIDVETGFDMFGQSEVDQTRVENLLQNLDDLTLTAYAIKRLPLASPIKASYRMTSPYGYRVHPITRRRTMHTGQDMAAPMGTPIYAPGDGTVIFAGWSGGYGNTIKIEHEFGITTLYGHLSKILVNVGEHVALGEQIGKMGSTGRSTGSHLHYEVLVNGNTINPMNYLRAASYVQ